MQRNIKLTIEYDGTLFNGWQVQKAPNGRPRRRTERSQRTVQGEIECALKKIYKRSIKLIGSGRTDSGVHAWGQVAHFKVASSMPVAEIQNALNGNLPEDIAIIKVEEVTPDFHARYGARSKIYRYTILNRNARSALERKTCLYYPNKLNLAAMRRECKYLIGTKDFRSFIASDPSKIKKGKTGNTVRTIKRLDISKKGDHILIDIEADGFLYKMVRNIVSTLLEVGSHQLPKGAIQKILAHKDRQAAGSTAKAKGLALLEVKY
jgi:tRNA pseudouridine38-40 synthase